MGPVPGYPQWLPSDAAVQCVLPNQKPYADCQPMMCADCGGEAHLSAAIGTAGSGAAAPRASQSARAIPPRSARHARTFVDRPVATRGLALSVSFPASPVHG